MKKALVIGINEYPKALLAGCVNDANEVAQLLRTNADGSINYDVRCELNVKSKGLLRGMIEDLFSGNTENVLLYFSGHGTISATGGYIVTPDYSEHDMGVSMDDILSLANQSSCKNKVIILDCCHAGNLGLVTATGSNNAIICEGLTVLTACEKKRKCS